MSANWHILERLSLEEAWKECSRKADYETLAWVLFEADRTSPGMWGGPTWRSAEGFSACVDLLNGASPIYDTGLHTFVVDQYREMERIEHRRVLLSLGPRLPHEWDVLSYVVKYYDLVGMYPDIIRMPCRALGGPSSLMLYQDFPSDRKIPADIIVT